MYRYLYVYVYIFIYVDTDSIYENLSAFLIILLSPLARHLERYSRENGGKCQLQVINLSFLLPSFLLPSSFFLSHSHGYLRSEYLFTLVAMFDCFG